jgi:AbrB family looped-hinge helix DNA binding protein
MLKCAHRPLAPQISNTALLSAIIRANTFAMSTTITVGKSGRLVVPKSIRDQLGLHEGSRMKLEVLGGTLQAVPEPDPVNITVKGGFPVIQGGPAWKRGNVVQAIKADRDSRDERATTRSKQK